MNLIYLKEGRRYTVDDFAAIVNRRLQETNPNKTNLDLQSIFFRLKKTIDGDFNSTVVKVVGKGCVKQYVFRYVGLYDYYDEESGTYLPLFFLPKFIDFQEDADEKNDEGADDEIESVPHEASTGDYQLIQKDGGLYRDVIIRAISRYVKEEKNRFANREDNAVSRRGSILELAVRMLRDYLENGLYVVQRHELEQNGQGEIDWNTTITQFQPVIVRERPYYMDVMTEQAYSDEEHYITRLHKCLVTVWGRKLEELGLSSILRVNVPLLSEEELDHFGDSSFQIAQINKELNVQFVTKSRETLLLIKELIQLHADNQTSSNETLSFGVAGAEQLWESACASVLGSELDKRLSESNLKWTSDVTFRQYMPRPIWSKAEGGGNSPATDSGAYEVAEKSGWRLDFIRTWPGKGDVAKLVILDAKYYCVRWAKGGQLNGQPGIPDIAKQIFYQMAFKPLLGKNVDKHISFVNAFLFPDIESGTGLRKSELLTVGWGGGMNSENAFNDDKIVLQAFRIPWLGLLTYYADNVRAEDWFEQIAQSST